MMDLQLIWTGLLPLIGIVLGALLTTRTQLYLEEKRERRAADRAKQLVAGELLQAQLVLRSASKGKNWLQVEDINALLPTSAWRESRSSLADEVDEELWNQLVMAYTTLEIDRARFALVNRLPTERPLPIKEAEGLKEASDNLGRLRKKLGGGDAWLDESP